MKVHVLNSSEIITNPFIIFIIIYYKYSDYRSNIHNVSLEYEESSNR